MTQLDSLGITYVVLHPEDIDGILQDIELAWRVTGSESRAKELTKDMKERMARIVTRVQDTPKVKVFYTFATTDLNSPWTAGPGSFVDSLITMAGGENIGATALAPWIQFSLEEVLSSDPEVIVVDASHGSAVTPMEELKQHAQTWPRDEIDLHRPTIDEVQASIYNALIGFYRLAFSSLRNILEQMTIGLHLELTDNQKIFSDWVSGDRELRFGWATDNVSHHSSVYNLERHLANMTGDNLFQQKTQKKRAGFARRLYSELSQFTHGGPAFTNADLWDGSNGPIFVPKAFEKWSATFAKAYALGVLEVKLAQPKIKALGSGSSLTIRNLFKQIVNRVPQKEDGSIILQTILNLKDVWK